MERKYTVRGVLAGVTMAAAFVAAGWIDANSDRYNEPQNQSEPEVVCNEDEDRVEISSWDGEGHVTRGTYCIPLDNEEWDDITWTDR